MTDSNGDIAFTTRHLSKRFGGVRALVDVSLTVRAGEVHALLGENGSGKSTLIKILSGYHQPDPGGRLEIHGKEVGLPIRPGQFRDLGLSFVHQDLGLIRSLTVLENLRIGEMASQQRWWIRWRRERERVTDTLAPYGISLPPQVLVDDISPVERALLAIVRAAEDMKVFEAITGNKGVLVLDEPTVFLPKNDAERLYALIRELARRGSGVLFVSHDLNEVLEIADRITVLRDGRVIGTVDTAETSLDAVVKMIVGHTLKGLTSGRSAADRGDAEPRASVERVSGNIIRDVSFDMKAGEVVGVAGLMGSGMEELPYLLMGGVRAKAGLLALAGQSFDLRSVTPADACKAEIVLLPGDRARDGSIASLTVSENVMMPALHRFVNGVILRRRTMAKEAARLLSAFDVRPNRPLLPFSSLSGGNQQKTLLAKWLQTRPRLLLLHEPTQGVDVGAREQVFSIIRETAAGGTPVLCASTDYEQLELICDRVLVIARGQLVGQLVGQEITKERIAEQCYAVR